MDGSRKLLKTLGPEARQIMNADVAWGREIAVALMSFGTSPGAQNLRGFAVPPEFWKTLSYLTPEARGARTAMPTRLCKKV
jgi:hypothetical protein